MRFVLVLALLAGCEKTAPPDRVTADQAKAFAAQLGSAALPCDVNKVAQLVDSDAFVAKMAKAAHTAGGKGQSATYRDPHALARVLCAWNETAEDYRLLHVLSRDGTPRVVMRWLGHGDRTRVWVAKYHELGLELVNHQVRLSDIYSVTEGDWLSSLLASRTDAMNDAGRALESGDQLLKSRELQRDGKYAEALAVIDALPPAVRTSRMVQMQRLSVADRISSAQYMQALDEIATLFPADPSVAFVEVAGASLHGDYDAALANIDIVDKAVGGDPFQDAIRANMYLLRRKPGDLELAAARADAAIAAEPTLAKGWWSRLGIAVARKQYALAIETIQHIEGYLHVAVTDEWLHAQPDFADFVASPEYAAWRSHGG
jgi:hypothetical protein